MRVRMTEAERAAKRAARWRDIASGRAYRQYDPRLPGGSTDDWQAAAEMLLNAGGIARAAPKPADAVLRLLQPAYRPSDRADLVARFREAAKATHPDYGGTNERFRQVVEVYERLKRRFGWQ